jgi:hypothetical protein
MKSAIAVIGIVLLALIICIASPFFVLWALNTLFGFGLQYSFMNWLAMFLLLTVLKTNITNK